MRVTWPDGEVGPWHDRRRRTSSSTSSAAATAADALDAAGAMSADDAMTGGPRSRPIDAARLRRARPSAPELPAAPYAERRRARCAPGGRAPGYDRLVVYADREHSANLSFLTGFDPRFEEAMLVVGPTGDPAILVGNECWGMAGAAPLPMRAAPLPGPQPAEPAARPVACRSPRSSPTRASAAGSRVGVVGWKTYAGPDRRSSCRPSSSTSCASSSGRRGQRRERQRPADRPGRRAADHQRRRPAGGVRVGLVRRRRAASGGCSAGLRPGLRESRGGRAPRLERHAAVVPRDADRRAAGDASGCSAPATGRSSAATGSPPRSGSGAR